jgi:gas vesicle protein
MKSNNAAIIGGALLIGSAAGAVLALLYSPKSGVEIRKDVRKTAFRLKETAADVIEDTLEDVNKFSIDLKERTTDLIENRADVSDRAKKEIVATIEKGQKRIEKQKERLTRALGLIA